MGEKFREGDGSYRRYLQAEQEDEFINRATAAIEKGQPWSAFYKANPQYGVLSPAKWEFKYNAMADRRKASKTGEWSLQSELQLARNRRMKEQLAEADRREYEANKEDLLQYASDHASWTETKRRLGLTDDAEKYFRQAQQEAGVFRSSERPDPYDQAFADGFFG